MPLELCGNQQITHKNIKITKKSQRIAALKLRIAALKQKITKRTDRLCGNQQIAWFLALITNVPFFDSNYNFKKTTKIK